MTERDTKDSVAIIGAGPAGLTAAYLLSKHGYRVTVLEKDSVYVGGISRTVEYKGFRFDIGGHRFFSKSAAVVSLWNEILPNDLHECRRLSRIYYGGKFYSYPLNAVEALRNLGFLRSARCMLSFLKARLFPIKDVRSFQDWTVNQFGYELFSIFFRSYTEKVWGTPCNEISSDWAAQRIRGLNLWNALQDGLKRSLGMTSLLGRNSQLKTLTETFQYPRLGPGMMWEAARQHVERAGNTVMMGHEVTELSHDVNTKHWTVSGKTTAGDRFNITASHVITSAPMRELVECLEPKPRCAPQSRNLKYRDFLTVALMLRRDAAFPDNWIYIHDPRVKVGRIQNYSSWSESMVPDKTLACLGMEYFCFSGDSLWESSDADLISLAKRELGVLGLCDPAQVFDAVVVRQEKAYPVYDDDYAANVESVRSDLEVQFPTLHLVGRNGMHRYNNQDHSMLTAMLTVENILAGHRRFDVWAVNEDSDYHEAGHSGEQSGASGHRLVPLRRSSGTAA